MIETHFTTNKLCATQKNQNRDTKYGHKIWTQNEQKIDTKRTDSNYGHKNKTYKNCVTSAAHS